MKMGDFVKLKSGGDAMLIASVEGDEANCVLYDGKECSRRKFPRAALELAPPVQFGRAILLSIYEEASRDKP